MILGVNTDPERLPLPPGWLRWHAPTPIGTTYHRIAQIAVAYAWGPAVIVAQDDVEGELPPADGFTIYGWQRPDGHVCPRAFAATPEIWQRLEEAWRDEPRSLCSSFGRIARRHGKILNLCR